jgi:hypothetical protein
MDIPLHYWPQLSVVLLTHSLSPSGARITQVAVQQVYRLDGRAIRVQFPAGARDLSLLHSVHSVKRGAMKLQISGEVIR